MPLAISFILPVYAASTAHRDDEALRTSLLQLVSARERHELGRCAVWLKSFGKLKLESTSWMAQIRSKGGVVLNKYLVARVFAFDDHESEARAASVSASDGGRGAAPRVTRTVNGTGHTGPSEFCATSI